jgi:hypothetical protein
MKLYTRLIDSGAFICWNPDEGDTSYRLKIKVLMGNDEVELLDFETVKGQNYFSFDRVGTGDYIIELHGYRGDRLYQTETKKIKIVSSVMKTEEYIGQILGALSEMQSALSNKTDEYMEKIIESLSQIYDKLVKTDSDLYSLSTFLHDYEALGELKYRLNKTCEKFRRWEE